MSDLRPRRRRRHRFGPRAMAAAVAALDAGASVAAAARAAGFCASTLYAWRGKAPHFAAAWDDAVAASRAPALIRLTRADKGVLGYQLVRTRRQLFSREVKEIFLGHLAATCCIVDAARRTGISRACVYKHRDSDPAFAAAMHETIAGSAARLEAGMLARRLKAQAAYRASGDMPGPEEQEEFDRSLQLLREHKRYLAGIGKGGRPPAKMSFDDAFGALARELRRFGFRLPADNDGEEEEDKGAATG